jgi:hypothetical protein
MDIKAVIGLNRVADVRDYNGDERLSEFPHQVLTLVCPICVTAMRNAHCVTTVRGTAHSFTQSVHGDLSREPCGLHLLLVFWAM